MLATLKLSGTFALGAVTLNVALAEVVSQPISVQSIAFTFAGLALVYLANTIVKVDKRSERLDEAVYGEGGVLKRLDKMAAHFERIAEMVQIHAAKFDALEHPPHTAKRGKR